MADTNDKNAGPRPDQPDSPTSEPQASAAQEPGATKPETTRRRGLLGGIIATSKATTARPEPEKASMAARKCRNCGAGRPEGTDLRVCAYCGDRFMTDEANPPVDGSAAPPEA